MGEWWEVPYKGAKPSWGLLPLARPLYPPDAAGYGKKPSTDGDDCEALRRVISRLGRAPWAWAVGENKKKWSNTFAHGASGGNVADSGVAGFQRQQNISPAYGWWGEASHNASQYALVPDHLPHGGEPGWDDQAISLYRKAIEKHKHAPAGKLTRRAIPSPNYSSRGGKGVRLIVIHTTQGARTIEELGNYFANPSVDASSHVGIDDNAGVIGEYVRRPDKAWTAANANPVAIQGELCAFAEWSADEWHRHGNMLDNCARWIAEEADYFDIPITRLSPSQAQGGGRGVCQHDDLGDWGGGHWDCGGGFPMDHVLDLAREL